MRHYFTVVSHEVRMLLVNPFTYVAAVLFLGVTGFMFTDLLEEYTRAPQELSPANGFFQMFWLPVIFMVPLLTMKTIADERRSGTLETLLTTPVSTVEVVLGKFTASYLLYLMLWLATSAFFLVLSRFPVDPRFFATGPLIGGYLFMAVSGLFFVGVGIFTSSLSRSQPVAGILSSTLLIGLIIGSNLVNGLEVFNHSSLQPFREILSYAQVFDHLQDFTRGIVDTRHVLFYLSGSCVTLILSVLSIEAKIIHS
ncbi:MAG: ABC transporter permease [Opitutaceae bacterium]|nr:ABC transporter permease [Opitutaceae bacterium]